MSSAQETLKSWAALRSMTSDQHDEVVIVLTNERSFYEAFLKATSTRAARVLINDRLKRQYPDIKHNAYDRELLAHEFREQWGVAQYRHTDDSTWLRNVRFVPTDFRTQPAPQPVPQPVPQSVPQPTPQPTPQEPHMSKIIKIETRIFVNGQDVAGLKDDDVYQLIADQEKAISELEKIQTKPKRLQKEIDDRRAGIEALVKMLDERDTKTTA